jgi:hypothetical protein
MEVAGPSERDEDELPDIVSRDDVVETDTDDERPVSRLSDISSASASSEKTSNPWPYLSTYFKFVSRTGDAVKYKCILCRPKEKTLSGHVSSRNNLKLHIRTQHPRKKQDFETLLDSHFGRKQKHRKE